MGYNPKITDEYCGLTYDDWDGAASHMLSNSRNGMVLSMSAWYDQEIYNNGRPSGGSSTGMSWLDGINDWGKLTKTGPCATTTTDLGHHGATSPRCECGWVDQWGCHGSDGSFCYEQCCGRSNDDCDCSWVNQYGCHGSDGSH